MSIGFEVKIHLRGVMPFAPTWWLRPPPSSFRRVVSCGSFWILLNILCSCGKHTQCWVCSTISVWLSQPKPFYHPEPSILAHKYIDTLRGCLLECAGLNLCVTECSERVRLSAPTEGWKIRPWRFLSIKNRAMGEGLKQINTFSPTPYILPSRRQPSRLSQS